MCVQNWLHFSLPAALPNPCTNLLPAQCSFAACPCILPSHSEESEAKTSGKKRAKAKNKPPAQGKQKKAPRKEVEGYQDEMEVEGYQDEVESPDHDPDDYEDMELKQREGSFTDEMYDEDLYQNT